VLADGPTTCGDVVKGGCYFTWKFNVIGSTVLTEAGRRTTPNVLWLEW
jgi:hypothetical protein